MEKDIIRLLDADFNRAREALRVMEDFARFILNDSRLTETAKQLRHDLCRIINLLPLSERLSNRDIVDDVGVNISTVSETSRADTRAVVQAAANRLTEALRCLEEYVKIENPETAANLESLRYRSYQLEKQILSRSHLSGRLQSMRLYVLVTEFLCRKDIIDVVDQILTGPCQALQLREKDKSDSDLLLLSRKIARRCHDADTLFIMNDRADLAVLADADGVHLGRDDLPVKEARKILKSHMIVGKSTHSLAEAQKAAAEEPDYLSVGSVFGSPTKPNVPCCGTDLLRRVAAFWDRPLVAIGGVTSDNAQQAFQAGASAVAVCHTILSAENPDAVTRSLFQKVKSLKSSDRYK